MLASIVPMLLAAAAPSAADRTLIEQTVVGIITPYYGPSTVAAWDYPVYSQDIAALIARWKAVMPEGELDGLNDGDWLCQCQDWDGNAFQATIVSIEMADDDTARVALSLDLGLGGSATPREETLVLRREGEGWKIDDIVAESFPDGLRQALRATIADDEAAGRE